MKTHCAQVTTASGELQIVPSESWGRAARCRCVGAQGVLMDRGEGESVLLPRNLVPGEAGGAPSMELSKS
jgi:hypothetical protein